MSQPATKVAIALAAIALVGGIAWRLTAGAGDPGAPSAGMDKPNVVAAPDQAPIAAAAAAPAATTAAGPAATNPVAAAKAPPSKFQVTYPGGTTMPALNGVDTDVKLNWGQGPFTPIVGVVDGPGGWQWYVHENGAHSTTAMVTMNGVPNAMGIVAEPSDPLPVLDPAAPQKPPQK